MAFCLSLLVRLIVSTPPPSASLDAAYDTLAAATTTNRAQVPAVIAKAQALIDQKGIHESKLDVARHLLSCITPESRGQMSLEEIAAAYVTLRTHPIVGEP